MDETQERGPGSDDLVLEIEEILKQLIADVLVGELNGHLPEPLAVARRIEGLVAERLRGRR